ncbi:MAG: ABC transporter permease, partial [Sulfolobales archaeon]
LLGTNDIGQDIFSEFIYGARVSLFVGLTAPFIASILGTMLGLIAGYLGGVADEVVTGAIDVMLALPSLPLIIILAAYLGPSLNNIILVLAFFGWSGFARIVRAQVLSLRERPYVEAAKAVGAGGFRIMVRHILPHVVPLIIANIVLSATSAILTEAGLSFLGLGDPTVKSWGQILRRAQVGHAFHQGLWLWVFVPGLGIALLGAGFTLLGIAIEERVNPRLRFSKR